MTFKAKIATVLPLALMALLAPLQGGAQPYPNHPIRLVVGFAPGTASWRRRKRLAIS